jgi:DnaJ-domain-containing protein 1
MRYVVTGYSDWGIELFHITIDAASKEDARRRARSHMGSARYGACLLRSTHRLEAHRAQSSANLNVNWKAAATVILVVAAFHFGDVTWLIAFLAGGTWFVQRRRERSLLAQRLKLEEFRREARRREAERIREAQRQREAERKGWEAEKQRQKEQQRQGEREQATPEFAPTWWRVLEVTPTASRDEIVRKYRHKIQRCHPDRVAGLAPEFLRLAEERTKELNAAYSHAMRAHP